MTNTKSSGQVFTPPYLVSDMLNVAGYLGDRILNKHIIDNSCGNGAFLCEIVRRYIDAFLQKNSNLEQLKEELETFVHGIEIDPDAYQECLSRLTRIASDAGLFNISWNIMNADTLSITLFDGKMDYVVGNPPYVRVHNLESSYSTVKRFHFAEQGMTDLYLVFFEIGFNMLSSDGKLCYITPNSWLNSIAGKKLREYIKKNKILDTLIDLGHSQVFDATTYTIISLFTRSHASSEFFHATYDVENKLVKYLENISVKDALIGGNLFLAPQKRLNELRAIIEKPHQQYAVVKNGFATLNDKIFIRKSFPFQTMVIDVVKASTGEWKKAFFPYDGNGVPLSLDKIKSDEELWKYLLSNKTALSKNQDSKDNSWFLYGRTQALKDVCREKYAINTIIKDLHSIKLQKVCKGQGVYSGLYILTEISESVLRDIIYSDDFLNYVRTLKKYKSGGYYTFNSKELQQFLNYKINKFLHSDSDEH